MSTPSSDQPVTISSAALMELLNAVLDPSGVDPQHIRELSTEGPKLLTMLEEHMTVTIVPGLDPRLPLTVVVGPSVRQFLEGTA
jgi:hypothetical protein